LLIQEETKKRKHALFYCCHDDIQENNARKLLPVVHPYWEYYDNVYHDLKKHALEFMMEQLSHAHPGKCCGKMFEVFCIGMSKSSIIHG
jgi:hypothetical protein